MTVIRRIPSVLVGSVKAVSSFALHAWQQIRGCQLDELDAAHTAVGGRGPGRRSATLQLNHAYAVVLASQFQGFCRDLHSECADTVTDAITMTGDASTVDGSALADIALMALTRNRQLDRGNASAGSIGADFKAFDLDIWEAARRLDARTPMRARRLDQLNVWRNPIAHQDFDFSQHQRELVGEPARLGLSDVRAFRSACDGLAATFDRALVEHLQSIVGSRPW
jgi:hypothetical protein